MNKTALITGASSGIGRELALIHASQGGDLVIVARRKHQLESLKEEIEKEFKVKVWVFEKDLSVQGSATDLYNEIKTKGIEINYLINNAGFGGNGKFSERNWESDKAMINVNIMALTELTRTVLPDMIQRNNGKILNISSTASFLPGPLMAVYYATKAYVTSFSQAIAEELRDTNITVTALCPGGVATEFAKVAEVEDSIFFKKGKVATAKSVAAFGYKTMIKGKLVAINDPLLRFGLGFVPLMPRRWVLKVSRWMMEKN